MSELRIGKATVVGDITLIPLFRIELNSIQQPDFLWFNGTAEAYAVVIIEPEGVRAVGVEESEVPLDTLHEQLPDLKATLDQWIAC